MNRCLELFNRLAIPRLGFFASERTLVTCDSGHPTARATDLPLVEIIGVNLHFGDKTVFNEFDLQIAAGERLVLLGPSGIGKSSLLGTLQPDSRRVAPLPQRLAPAFQHCPPLCGQVGNAKYYGQHPFRAKTRFYFDKVREAAARDFEKIVSMKSQPAKLSSLSNPLPETGRIYLAIIVGGVAILLMILAEMKFFGT